MAIGRVAGPLLESDLDRQGVDLKFTTNNLPLLELDFSNFQVSINANPSAHILPTLLVNGNATIANISVNDTTISSVGHITLTPASLSNVIISGNTLPSTDYVFDIGSTTKRWVNIFADTLDMSGATIATDVNGNITILPNGGVTAIANLIIVGPGSTFTGNVVSANAIITGGSINGTVIGNTVPADALFTSMTTGNVQITGGNISNVTIQSISLTTANAQITGGNISNVIITNSPISGSTGDFTIANITTYNTGNITIQGETISSTGNIILSPTLPGNISVTNSTISNVGYPVFQTDAASAVYVVDTINAMHPNTIWQGDSIIRLSDINDGNALPASTVTITLDGKLISTFTNTAATFANLTISGNRILGVGNIALTPATNKVVIFGSNTAIQLPKGDSPSRPATPTAGYFRYNTTSNLTEVFDGTDWISMIPQIASQIIVGDGINQTFAIDQPAPANNMLVMIHGVVQVPFAAYTTVGTNITFAEIPPLNEVIEIRFITRTTSPVATFAPTVIIDPPVVLAGNSNVVIDSFSVNAYSSAKYTISTKTFNGNVQLTDILLAHNGSTDSQLFVSQTSMTGGSSISVTYSTDIQSGLCRLSAVSTDAGTALKIQKTYITV